MNTYTSQQRRVMVLQDNKANCRTCGKVLSLEHFYTFKTGMPRLDCKVCHNKKTTSILRTKKGREWKRKVYLNTPPEVRKAWNELNIAIKNGVINRPLCCTLCSSSKRIQAHHEDYNKPLDVIWLCEQCHKKIHDNK